MTLSVEGRIVGRWVAVLEAECRRHLSRDCRVVLDLGEVRFVDRTGIAALYGLVSEGVQVIDASPFVADLMERGG